MELKLVKCKPLAGESFRPSDVVSGRLQIKGAVFDKKSTITAVLQGKLIDTYMELMARGRGLYADRKTFILQAI